jgi:hypothetical protein
MYSLLLREICKFLYRTCFCFKNRPLKARRLGEVGGVGFQEDEELLRLQVVHLGGVGRRKNFVLEKKRLRKMVPRQFPELWFPELWFPEQWFPE